MITIYDWIGYEIPIKERYQLIKKAGFDGVLMWWSSDFGRGDDYRNGPKYAAEAGLLIENIHTPILCQNNLWLDNQDGETVFDTYMQCISDCKEFAIPTMVVHLPNDEHPYNELGLSRVKKMAEKAEQLGINIAMENLWNIKNLSYILKNIDSKRVGYCYDACHHFNNKEAGDLLALYGDRLMALHLHDNKGVNNQHQLPFDGDIDWTDVMKKIVGTGYQGATALEPMNWDYHEITPEEFFQKAVKVARRLDMLRKE